MLLKAQRRSEGMLSTKFYSDKLMEWSMADHAFKVQLFRFVDAFPMLRSPEDIYEHLVDYLGQPGVKLPPGADLGMKAGGIAKGIATRTISSQITSMAEKFIAGTDALSAHSNLEKLWNRGIAFSVDLLGEACVSDVEADLYRGKYLDLVTKLPDRVENWRGDERLETDHLGVIPRTNVSIKISSLSARCDPIDPEGCIEDLMGRLEPILETARDRGVFVNFDMEESQRKELTLELFRRCVERIDFEAGIAMQAYLRSGVGDARKLCDWARSAGRVVTVRLVKGAYWDSEVIRAEQMGWPSPVWTVKRESDACFERMTEVLLDACPRKTGDSGVKLALGSHNVRSIAAAMAGLERRSLPLNAIEVQMLHGMADQLKRTSSEMGLRVREYVPVGEMIPGMAYLVRRLLENTSNESWLKAGFLDNRAPAVLLASPHDAPVPSGANASDHAVPLGGAASRLPERHRLSSAVDGVGDGRPFFSEALRDFESAETRRVFSEAVASVSVPIVANDCSVDQAAAMVRRAHEYFPVWRDADPRHRAGVLTRAASAMRRRRDELSGVVVLEAGKTWREADADVCEAIEFCEYYARAAVPLFERDRLGRFMGELDETWYQARGVVCVISPWNFPLAICCGMTTAALVTGNTVILKPAEQTPGIAKILVDILHQAGCPAEALHFCPAPGETTGASLVRDPRVSVVAFTGSKAVGLDIIEAASVTSESQQRWGVDATTGVKRVVCEMGGKNAIIVDSSADLDEAVIGVRDSAFGFQGQKCSACSRLIVVDPAGSEGPAITHVIGRLVNATASLVIGDPSAPGTDFGPVIDEAAAANIQGFIETARSEGCQLYHVSDLPSGDSFVSANASRFVTPHIFGATSDQTIAREEIFGPVLAVMHASCFDEALEIANASPYKLTGGVYSRRPSNLERAKRSFRVGNLYLNRPCTGALVARQPFGGFGLSGVGSKAGGANYLYQFVDPRASSENMMRRGFAPEL